MDQIGGCVAAEVYAAPKERQCRADTSERFSHSPLKALEFLAVGGHREKELGKTRCLQMLQLAQAFIFINSNHHNGGLAMFSYHLRFAPRRLTIAQLF
jgi:hypothetical protein